MSLNVHRSEHLDPYARGEELGRRWRSEIVGTACDYTWLFEAAEVSDQIVRHVASRCYAALRAWAPELAAEIAGVAAGAGIPLEQAAAMNARTEILVRGSIAGLKECSSLVWLPPGRPPRAIQTWDWIPTVHNFSVLQHTSQDGLGVVTFAENGVVGKLGVNSAGLGLLFTLLCHTSDGTIDGGVPVHAVARRILDSATSVDEALDLLRSAPVMASASLTVMHWDGGAASAVTAEIAPAGLAVLAPEDGYLLHTNHFLDPVLATGDRLAAIEDDTLPRMASLRERRSTLAGSGPTAWARGLICHWEDGAPVCAHPRPDAPVTDRWETKMLFSPELSTPGLMVQEGGPCRATDDGWLMLEPGAC